MNHKSCGGLLKLLILDTSITLVEDFPFSITYATPHRLITYCYLNKPDLSKSLLQIKPIFKPIFKPILKLI
jgi:hypothetical protein